MTKSEANKAFCDEIDWLKSTTFANCYGDTRNGDEMLDKIIAALTRLSELEPIIQELVEARKKATEGEWVLTESTASHGYYIESNAGETISDLYFINKGGEVHEFDNARPNAAFITLAANRIAKIGGVDE